MPPPASTAVVVNAADNVGTLQRSAGGAPPTRRHSSPWRQAHAGVWRAARPHVGGAGVRPRYAILRHHPASTAQELYGPIEIDSGKRRGVT
ncbi:MAG: hypothetical protein NZP34_12035 [Caldilineales bacterium]|nr:hypothetical protein [Caldilineales bacterium]